MMATTTASHLVILLKWPIWASSECFVGVCKQATLETNKCIAPFNLPELIVLAFIFDLI